MLEISAKVNGKKSTELQKDIDIFWKLRGDIYPYRFHNCINLILKLIKHQNKKLNYEFFKIIAICSNNEAQSETKMARHPYKHFS